MDLVRGISHQFILLILLLIICKTCNLINLICNSQKILLVVPLDHLSLYHLVSSLHLLLEPDQVHLCPVPLQGGLGSLALVAPRIHCHQMWHLLGPLAHHLDLSLLLVSLRDRFLLGRCHLLWVLPLFPLPVVLRRNWDLVLINNHTCLLL